MTWTRLSDDFPDRPDLLECSRSARLLHVEALVYANRHLTDGRIPTSALARFSDSDDLDADLEQLASSGVWRKLHVGAWQIEGWTDREHQESAAEVQAREKYNRDKQATYRKRKAEHSAGNHDLCAPGYCAGRRKHDAGDHSGCTGRCSSTVTGNETSNGTGDKTSHVTGRVTNSPPLPARPLPKGQGQGRCEHGYPVITEADGETTTGCHTCTSEQTPRVEASVEQREAS